MSRFAVAIALWFGSMGCGCAVGEVVDLRGYGKVEAKVGPNVSEFVCESDAKADSLLGKLLADVFWDAGTDHVLKSVRVGSREVPIHLWRPYGAAIIGRNQNEVFVIGGEDEASAVALADRRPITSDESTRFEPAKPYPKFLDFYDLGAAHCYSNGLNSMNKYRYKERSEFVSKFFPGGLLNASYALFLTTLADGIRPETSLLDTDMLLAEKYDQAYGISISTGDWPEWARNKWPSAVDQSSPLHPVQIRWPGLGLPESLGLDPETRRQSSLKFLGDVMLRYRDNPRLSGWQLYCGDYVWETFFWKGHQGHLGYTPIGKQAYLRWLRDVRGYSLAKLGQRWHADGGYYKHWDDVELPEPDVFCGSFNAECLPIRDSWVWKKAQTASKQEPAGNEAGWTPVPMPPSTEQVLSLPDTSGCWRTSFDPSNWLKRNAGKDIYLICNVDNGAWRTTPVWLNGRDMGQLACPFDSSGGPLCLNVTGMLKSGGNTLCLRVPGSGGVNGPVFLTTTRPQVYPYLGKLRNAQYVDSLEWRLYELTNKQTDAMAYARSIDPDRPFVICPTSHSVADALCDALGQYGGSMEDTGYESSYRPFNSRLGYAGGFYGSCEPASMDDLRDPKGTRMTRRLNWTLLNGEGMYVDWWDPYVYFDVEKQTGWFTKNKRKYQLIGKFLPEKPQIAVLQASGTSLLADEWMGMDWNVGRGELHAAHFDNVAVTEKMLERGFADDYPVLFDSNTLVMSEPLIDAITQYVEKGGTFIALQNSGRHSLLEPDTWPISRLTGFKVQTIGKKGNIRFEKTPPLLKKYADREFAGEGNVLDWKEGQYAKDVSVALTPLSPDAIPMAHWQDGAIALGVRTLGKGRVIVLGSTFWRDSNDLGGTGYWRAGASEIGFLESLLTDLDVRRTAFASTPDVYARKMITKNGLQDNLIAMNTTGEPVTVEVAFAAATRPDAVWDQVDKTPVPFAYADGWVRISDVQIPLHNARIFAARRDTIAQGVAFWWGEKIKFWSHRALVPPFVNTETTANQPSVPQTICFDAWRFLADHDGTVGKSGDWLKPAFDDGIWRRASNLPWNLQFDDLRDYSGVALYRSLPFVLPPEWRTKRVTVNGYGATNAMWGNNDQLGYCWSSFELYVNGNKIDGFFKPWMKVDITDQLKDSGNVLCIKLTGKNPSGDFPLSGLTGSAIWIQPEIRLSPSLSLLGQWQGVMGDWVTSRTVDIPGIDPRITDNPNAMAQFQPVRANHLVREVMIPADWQGKDIYLHLVTPSHTKSPAGVGMIRGMVRINGRTKLLNNSALQAPLDTMLNLTPNIKFGEINRFELWTSGARQGSMTEENIVINDVAIGCAAE